MGAPYMPLYVDDLLQDEKCIGLSAAPFGAWTRTFCLMWQREKSSLTMDMEGWETIWNCRGNEDAEKIMRQLKKVAIVTENEDGTTTIYSKRIDHELKVLEQKREEGRLRHEKWLKKKKSRSSKSESNALVTDEKHVSNGESYNSPSLSNSSSQNNSEEDERFSERDWQYAAATNFLDSLAKADCLTASTSAIEKRSEILQKWADVFDKLHRIDGHDQATILSVCHWLFQPGNWWIENKAIRTAMKLRQTNTENEKYFDILLIQSKRKNHAKNDAKQNPISSAARIRDAILADDY